MADRQRAAVHAPASERAHPPAAPHPSRSPVTPAEAALFGLQRSAGNASVAELLQRWPMGIGVAPALLTLTANQLQQAKAGTTDLGLEALNQLQEKLGVTKGGSYDDDTAQAVFAKQRTWQPTGAIAHPGVADDTFFSRLGLVRTKDFDSVPLAPHVEARALASQLAARFPNGFSIAAYSLYDDVATNGNAKEFQTQAAIFAKGQQSVGLSGGGLKVGVSLPIDSVADLVEKVQGIHLALVEAWLASRTSPTLTPEQAAIVGAATGGARQAVAMETGQPADEPAWTRMSMLATFAHGIHRGLNLHHVQESQYAAHGLHLDNTPGGQQYASNIESFARGLKGAASPDIKVLVFACSAAGSSDFEHYSKPAGWSKREADAKKAAKKAYAKAINLGKSAFEAQLAADAAAAASREGRDAIAAADLAAQQGTGGGSLAEGLQGALKKELGGKPSVYGHLTAAHTTRNPAAKVYGADAGNQPGGMHMFNRVYDQPYLDGQIATLFPATRSTWIAYVRPKLVTRMYEYFYDQIEQDSDKGWKGRGGKPIAQEMFADFKTAQALLQADMTDWLRANTDDLAPPASVPFDDTLAGPPHKP